MATTPPRSSSSSAENDKPLFMLSREDPIIIHYSSGSSPDTRGSPVRETPADDVDQEVRYYDRQDYDDLIHEELYNRVFVDFEAFMKTVLHVPADWKDVWGPAIAAVKTNEIFTKFYTQYRQKCDHSGLHKKTFYTPFVDTISAVLDALSGSGIVPHQACRPPNESDLQWTNPLHIIEVKPYGSAICNGENIRRLIVKGELTVTPFCGWR